MLLICLRDQSATIATHQNISKHRLKFHDDLKYLSDSPSHLETRSDDLTEKNVELFASVATAFARNVLPVPGG